MVKDAMAGALNRFDFLMGSSITINGYGIQLLGIDMIDLPSLWISKKHCHDFYELHYVLNGDCYTRLGEVEHCVRPGHYYIIRPGTMHSHRSQRHLGMSMRWRIERIAGHPAGDVDFKLMHYVQQLESAGDRVAADDAGRLLDRLMDISDHAGTCSSLSSHLEYISFVLSLPAAMSFSGPARAELPVAETNSDIVDACIRYINDHCLSDIGVTDVANHVHLSYGHISRLFRKSLGTTIKQEILIARLRKSQHLLLNTNDSIAGIARRVGFSTTGHFSRAFGKAFRVTPREYRKTHRRLDE